MRSMCAPTSMHNTAGQCVSMPVCVRPGHVGKHMPTYFHTLICRFNARVHVAILQSPDAQHVCTNPYVQHYRPVCAHAIMHASTMRGNMGTYITITYPYRILSHPSQSLIHSIALTITYGDHTHGGHLQSYSQRIATYATTFRLTSRKCGASRELGTHFFSCLGALHHHHRSHPHIN